MTISPPPVLPDLTVKLGRLSIPNPIMVASGTFGYANEMKDFVPLHRLGGVVPKTITVLPRVGNRPWRTIETAAGLLNSIGLDNDGIDQFVLSKLPFLQSCGAPVVVSIAGGTVDEFILLAEKLDIETGIAAIELNISCPNVSHGVDFATDPHLCRQVVEGVRSATQLPVIAKLTPNVTDITVVAQAAADGGADAVTLINTCQGIAVDWRKQRTLLGNGIGGLSGPAIKPIALRCVHQVYKSVGIPIIGVGGIMTTDDCMEFFIAGASAIQIGTASFAEPVITSRILDELPTAVGSLGASELRAIVGSLRVGEPAQASKK